MLTALTSTLANLARSSDVPAPSLSVLCMLSAQTGDAVEFFGCQNPPCLDLFCSDADVFSLGQVPKCKPLAEIPRDGDEEQVREPCTKPLR